VGALPTGTVTFLFTDIEGSTRLQYEVGVERYAEIRAEHHRLLRAACTRHGGVEVDSAGDGLFVAFPTATGGVSGAVDAQRAVQDLVGVRMGLHSGEPLLTPDGYAGVEVARAARISAVAHGGQIVLSQTTAELVGDHAQGITLLDLGEHVLKDLSRPQRLYQLGAAGLRDDFPPLTSIRDSRTNLPAQRPELIGREDELRRIAELLRGSDRRLVTLTGPGGSGKTALAIEAAAQSAEGFGDGVFLVRLETVDDPSLVPSAIADVLPVPKPDGVPPERLAADFLRASSALVVLDNFEYVLGAAPAVAELAAGSERARFLVTSVAPLRVSAEVEFPVHPLALPSPAVDDVDDLAGSSAVALFTDRARQARPTFTLTAENASAVARVCIALDGLPLALELAAARTRVLSPSALLERVEHPLELLEGRARDRPDRHRALRATIDWSHELLAEAHRRLFARLSVFSGGATLEAIDAVCRPGDDLALDLVDGVSHLVECSLLETDERGDELRFTLLETIRAYARERLDLSGDAGELHRRHAEYYLGDPALAEVYLVGYDARVVVDRLEFDLANVRAALEWAHTEGSPHELPLAILYQRSPQVFSAEARRLLLRALERDDGQNPRLRARALSAAGGISRQLGDADAARLLFEESVDIYRELEDTTGALAHVLMRMAHAAMDRDDLDEAVRLALQSDAVARVSDSRDVNSAYVLGTLGTVDLARGELEEARAHFGGIEEFLPDDIWTAEGLALVTLLEGRPAEAVVQLAGCLRKLDLGLPDQRDGWALIEDLASALLEVDESSTSVRLYAAARTWHAARGTFVGFGWPPRLRTRMFAAVEELAASPAYDGEAREGCELDLEGAVELGLEVARRVEERA
jgi:predicted ATPase/class 3 adenylate cyclase